MSPATTYVSTWPLLMPMTTAEHVSPYLHKYEFKYCCYCCCDIDMQMFAACAAVKLENGRIRCKPCTVPSATVCD